jgi:hypothetical protein
MLGWDQIGFHKKHAETPYDELVFLHPVGFAGHIVDSRASGVQNVDALFLNLKWDRYNFHKNQVGTRYAEHVFLHPVGSACHVMHFSASEVQNVNAQVFMLRRD